MTEQTVVLSQEDFEFLLIQAIDDSINHITFCMTSSILINYIGNISKDMLILIKTRIEQNKSYPSMPLMVRIFEAIESELKTRN